MASALDSGASGPGSSLGREHCVVFLGKTLKSHRASLHSGVFIRNRTFLVRFGGISGEFGRAMVRILARLRLSAKIPMERPYEPDMQRTKKLRLGIYRTQVQPKI